MTVDARRIQHAIADKFRGDGFLVAFEVRNSTGSNANRAADAIAVHQWPSRQWAIHGFEIKVSRSDLARELANPKKADVMWQYCDYWWLAVPQGLVSARDVPEDWGIFTVGEDTGKALRKPAFHKATKFDRGFMVAFTRRIGDLNAPHVEAQVARQQRAFDSQVGEAVERRTRSLRQELEGKTKWIADFEEALGQRFHDITWENPQRLAAQLQLARMLGGDRYGSSLGSIERTIETLLARIKGFREEMEKANAA